MATSLAITVLTALVSLLLLGREKAWLAGLLILWFVMPAGVHGIGGFYPALIFAAVAIPRLWSSGRSWTKEAFFRWAMVVAAVYVVSVLWSSGEGPLHEAVEVVLVAGMCVCVYAVGRKRDLDLGFGLMCAAPFVLIQAVSTIYLNHHFALKATYYTSHLAEVLLGTMIYRMEAGTAVINATSENKTAGLFFTNGNRASMVMGVCGLVYLAFAMYARKRWAHLVALLSFVAVVETQSKSGIALMVGIPALALIQVGLANRLAGASRLWGLFVGALGAVFVVGTYSRWVGLISDQVDSALLPRTTLWSTAWSGVMNHPLTGWGWNGWWDHWPDVAMSAGIRTTYPPHNFLLYAGTRAGLPLMIAQLLFGFALFLFATRGITRMESRRQRLVLAAVGAATVWSFAHGMADNTEFYGTFNSIPFIAVGLTLCAAVRRNAATAQDPPERPTRHRTTKYDTVHQELVEAGERRHGAMAPPETV